MCVSSELSAAGQQVQLFLDKSIWSAAFIYTYCLKLKLSMLKRKCFLWRFSIFSFGWFKLFTRHCDSVHTCVSAHLWRACRSVVHGRRASFLLHKDGLPLLPAARRLGQVALPRLLPARRFGQLPLLPVVTGCGRPAGVKNSARELGLSEVMTQQLWFVIAVAQDNHAHSLYLVFVWTEQFSGHLSVTRAGLKRFGQHCSFTHTFLQKSGIWSARRTILMVER